MSISCRLAPFLRYSYIFRKSPFEPTPPLFGAPVVVTMLEFRLDFWRQKTRVPELSYGVVCVIIHLTVTDRRTDRQTHDDSIYRASVVSRGKNH